MNVVDSLVEKLVDLKLGHILKDRKTNKGDAPAKGRNANKTSCALICILIAKIRQIDDLLAAQLIPVAEKNDSEAMDELKSETPSVYLLTCGK